MSEFSDAFNEMGEDARAVFGLKVVTIAGTAYNAVVTGPQITPALGEHGEGLVRAATLQVWLERSELATPPAAGAKVTYDSVVYRVESIENDEDDDAFQLNCVGEAQ